MDDPTVFPLLRSVLLKMALFRSGPLFSQTHEVKDPSNEAILYFLCEHLERSMFKKCYIKGEGSILNCLAFSHIVPSA